MPDTFSAYVYQIGDFFIAPGASVEYTITYPTYLNVTAYNSINTQTSPNQRFAYATTGTIVDSTHPEQSANDTTFFVTVTNQSGEWGEFFFVSQAIYYSE